LNLCVEIVGWVEEQVIYFGDLSGDPVVGNRLEYDRREPLVEGCNLLYLPGADRRRYRLRADNKYDRISLTDEPEQFATPILKLGKVSGIYSGRKAALLQGRYYSLGECSVVAGIRD
jgi:hypothetical protein